MLEVFCCMGAQICVYFPTFPHIFSLNFSLSLQAFGWHHLKKLIILLYLPACHFVERFYHHTETPGSFFCINVCFYERFMVTGLAVKWNRRLGTGWTFLYGQEVKRWVKGCDMQQVMLLLLSRQGVCQHP